MVKDNLQDIVQLISFKFEVNQIIQLGSMYISEIVAIVRHSKLKITLWYYARHITYSSFRKGQSIRSS